MEKRNEIAEVEKAAFTLIALMTNLCESQVAPGKEPSPKHKALASCIVAIRDALKTFGAIVRM